MVLQALRHLLKVTLRSPAGRVPLRTVGTTGGKRSIPNRRAGCRGSTRLPSRRALPPPPFAPLPAFATPGHAHVGVGPALPSAYPRPLRFQAPPTRTQLRPLRRRWPALPSEAPPTRTQPNPRARGAAEGRAAAGRTANERGRRGRGRVVRSPPLKRVGCCGRSAACGAGGSVAPPGRPWPPPRSGTGPASALEAAAGRAPPARACAPRRALRARACAWPRVNLGRTGRLPAARRPGRAARCAATRVSAGRFRRWTPWRGGRAAEGAGHRGLGSRRAHASSDRPGTPAPRKPTCAPAPRVPRGPEGPRPGRAATC